MLLLFKNIKTNKNCNFPEICCECACTVEVGLKLVCVYDY